MAFPDDLPTLRLFPTIHSYLARAQEGLGLPEARASYEAFLALQPQADGDPLVVDARRRLGTR